MSDEPIKLGPNDAVLIVRSDGTHQAVVPVNHRELVITWPGLVVVGLSFCLGNQEWTDRIVRRTHKRLIEEGNKEAPGAFSAT